MTTAGEVSYAVVVDACACGCPASENVEVLLHVVQSFMCS